jgi:hypothetical protein
VIIVVVDFNDFAGIAVTPNNNTLENFQKQKLFSIQNIFLYKNVRGVTFGLEKSKSVF